MTSRSTLMILLGSRSSIVDHDPVGRNVSLVIDHVKHSGPIVQLVTLKADVSIWTRVSIANPVSLQGLGALHGLGSILNLGTIKRRVSICTCGTLAPHVCQTGTAPGASSSSSSRGSMPGGSILCT